MVFIQKLFVTLSNQATNRKFLHRQRGRWTYWHWQLTARQTGAGVLIQLSFTFSGDLLPDVSKEFWKWKQTFEVEGQLLCVTQAQDSPPILSHICIHLSREKGHGMVDVKKPCKTDSNSPALYKGLLLGTVFVSPLTSCICHFTPGEREWEAVERYMRRERERSKRVI